MLDNAKKVLANEVSTQDEVNKALEDLNKAIDNLEVKEEPAKPGTLQIHQGDNVDGETVKTGDTQGSKVLLFASIAIIAGIACVYLKKKTVK